MYRNEGSGARVAVRLKGLPEHGGDWSAHDGARRGGGTAGPGNDLRGRYLSGDDAMVFAAWVGDEPAGRIEVTWRSGMRSVVSNAEPNRLYEIAESGAVKAASATQAGREAVV